MAEIKRSDLIAPDAETVFLDLAKTVGVLQETIETAKSSSKTFSDTLGSGNASVAQLKETVQGLSAEQKVLNQQQSQLAVINAKMTDEYQAQNAVIKEANAQLKQKTQLGDREAISINAQNASIVQLGAALEINRKAYSALTTEQQRQSVQGQQLLKVIQDQDKSLKQLQASIGQNQANVGGYTEAIEKAIPAFRALNPALVEAGEGIAAFGKKALALLLNPVVLVIAAIVAGLALMKKGIDNYIEGTVDGADRATVFATKWSTALELVNKGLKSIGASILNFIGFGEDNKLPGWIEAVITALPGGIAILASYNSLLEKNVEINRLQNEIKKEEIVLTVETAKLELEKEEELNAAREKANRNLQERYEALEKGDNARIASAKLSQQAALNELELTKEIIGKKGIEITAQTDLNTLFKDDLATKKLSYEQFELIAKTQKRLIDAQKEEYEGTRRIQALRSSLLDEQIKLILDQEKSQRESQQKLNEELIKTDQAKNARILANQSATLEEKVGAETKNMLDIEALNDKQTSDELFALREKGLQEIILDKETNDKINLQAGNNLKLRAQLILDAKNKEFDEDARFQSEVALLLEAGRKREEEIVKKSAENVVKITLDKAKQVAEAETSQSKVGKDQALIALNESLRNREISIIEFEKRKARIEAQGDVETLNSEIDGLEKQKEILEKSKDAEHDYAQDILKIDQQIADKKKEISDKETKLIEENLKKQYALEKQLANQALDTIQTISKNQTDAKVQALENQLTALQDNEQKQLTLAGDNAVAKAQIEARFAAEQKKIQKEEAKLKHDQAVRDKELAEAKILINTAISVSEALASGPPPGNIIVAALVGALGALEFAKAASTPIPAYFKGTDNHPGGLAVVGERGAELVKLPSGQINLTPNKATVLDLPKGAEVIPHPETMKRLALAGFESSMIGNSMQVNINLKEVTTEIKGLRSDMKKNKSGAVSYTRVGGMIIEAHQESSTHIKKVINLSINEI